MTVMQEKWEGEVRNFNDGSASEVGRGRWGTLMTVMQVKWKGEGKVGNCNDGNVMEQGKQLLVAPAGAYIGL